MRRSAPRSTAQPRPTSGPRRRTSSQRRDFVVWGGAQRPLVPAQVILRTQTHIYHHMGQVTAMCRLLGHPTPPGMDFPLTE
ncbi:MAG: DinB family protein [Phycisphaerales bacterium]